jgi:hypothetical protein
MAHVDELSLIICTKILSIAVLESLLSSSSKMYVKSQIICC